MAETSFKVTRRRATEADTDFARRAHHDAYRDLVERQFGAWVESVQDRYFAADWKPDSFQIVLCDEAPCGYLCLEDRGDDLHVREIVVRPEYQGRGIGTALLGEVIEGARRRGIPVRLGTHHQNRAIQLYHRLGFRDVGRTPTHVLLEWRVEPRAADAGP
jgi:GNAT superfamily N-acetyltransferase